MSGVLTPIGRGLYVSILNPKPIKINGIAKTDNDGNIVKRFSLTIAFEALEDMSPENREAWDAMVAHIKEVRDEKWPIKAPLKFRSPIRKSEEKEDDDGNLPDGYYPNGYFINVWCDEKYPCGIVGPDNTEVLPTMKGVIYSGAFYRAHVRGYAYDVSGNKGVSLGLNHVQKCRDGEQLGGGVPLKSAFEPIAGAKSKDSSEDMTTEDLF